MTEKDPESRYNNLIDSSYKKGQIDKDLRDHFQNRGGRIIIFRELGLENIDKYLPQGKLISWSHNFARKLKFPIEATSFLATRTNKEVSGVPGLYAYYVSSDILGGAIEKMTRGKRIKADNVAGATNRQVFGYEANIITSNNLLANISEIRDYTLFDLDDDFHDEYLQLSKILGIKAPPRHIFTMRTEDAFKKLLAVGDPKTPLEQKVAPLNPDKNVHVTFMTNENGLEYARQYMPKSKYIDYINTGEKFDMRNGMAEVKSRYNIEVVLNEGGRQMTAQEIEEGRLAQDNITITPWPGPGVFPDEMRDNDPRVLGKDGWGLDKSELKNAVRILSQNVNGAMINTYLYKLAEE